MLNVSNGSSKSEGFNLNTIEVLVDSEEQNWFKRTHVGTFLGLKHIDTSVGGPDKCEMPTRNGIKTPGPEYHQNNTDKFLSVFGPMYVIIKTQKDKGKAYKKQILKDIVPHGLNTRIEDIQGNHQEAITDRDNQVKALEFKNEKHQQKILRVNKEIDDLIANRPVSHRGCFDNVLRFIKNESTDSLKNLNDGSNFVTQAWRWLTNVMIQTPFIDGTGLSVK